MIKLFYAGLLEALRALPDPPVLQPDDPETTKHHLRWGGTWTGICVIKVHLPFMQMRKT